MTNGWLPSWENNFIKSPLVVILGEPSTWHSKAMQAALETRGARVSYADATRFTARLGDAMGVSAEETPLSQCDLLLVRDVPGGSLEQVIFRMDALHQLENAGLRIVNSPYAIEKMVDKYYTLSLLQGTGLRVPRTLVTENPVQGLQAFHELGEDVIVKPLFGSRGVGMVRLSDAETAGRVLRALQLGGYVYYLQKFLPHHDRDLRVMVVGAQCIAAMERVSDTWKTNIAAGARSVSTDLTVELQEVCLRAAQALGADYCGVDLLRSESGELFVLEVNSMPAWQGLQQVTSFDIADRIVGHCLGLLGG
jgi:RimK family alpha-L-glutamate ligase